MIVIWIYVWISYPKKKYENILEEIIRIGKNKWIKLNIIQELSFLPDSIYIFFEYLPNTIDILFVFINMDTFEISTAIYYKKSKILSQ